MRAFSLLLVLLALMQWRVSAYGYSNQGAYNPGGYASSASYSSTASSSSTGSLGNGIHSAMVTQPCCQLSSWAHSHMDEVRQFAHRLRQEYNSLSRGSGGGGNTYLSPWRENVIGLTGKTSSELDALSRQLSEQLVNDMRANLITYSTLAQPNYFEWRAAEALQGYAHVDYNLGQTQQQMVDLGQFQTMDLSDFDEVKNYAFPSEIKVIDGKMIVVHKNCTEAKKTTGVGSLQNPLISTYKRNSTIVTSNAQPVVYGTYGGYGSASNVHEVNSGALTSGGAGYRPIGGGSATTLTHKKTIYDWVNKNMEPGVVGYAPVVNVANTGNEWSVGGKLNSDIGSNVETIHNSQFGNSHYSGYAPGFAPASSTVTIKRFNQTIHTNADGTNTVQGSESNKKWVDGVLVLDTERPFGEWTVPRDDAWKREERERFFWFLSQGSATTEQLEEWQRQQEERLLALSQRYHTSLDSIHAWHRAELERYRLLQGQYQAQVTDAQPWQRLERGRLDWLIHQNSVTRDELVRWQHDNRDRLAHLAQRYRISVDELISWQIGELNRLYVFFNDQNNSMVQRPTIPNSESLHVNSEQERLEAIIRQHNATISQLQSSIQLDQQKLLNLSQTYRGNVQDMEQWLKGELARLAGIINEQRTDITRASEWQHSERARIEDMVKRHRGSVEGLQSQMTYDRTYLQELATKYHVSIDELEKYQRSEMERINREAQSQLEFNIKEWQRREHENLLNFVKKNDLTIMDLQAHIMGDRARLENLAKTYKVQVSEVEEWIKSEIKNIQSQGLLKEVEKELALWQKNERERLLTIVRQNDLTLEELQAKIKRDQAHLYKLAENYHVRVEDVEEWTKKEMLRLMGQGLVKVEEDLLEWQKHERDEILKIVEQNRLTIEQYEQQLLQDRTRLADLAETYNVQTSDIESWIKKEGQRLQSLGLLQVQEQLNSWQVIERDRLLMLVSKNNLSIAELEQKINEDQTHLYSLAHLHQVRVEEIEEWIKKEIQKLQQQGLVEMEDIKRWQSEWRGNLTNMLQERDFTVEQFHKWLLEDRARLQSLALRNNVQIEEIEQWVKNEEQRFVGMGLLKPNEKLTNWQEIERRYLERITQEQYHSTQQLEERLRQDRVLLERLARDYSVQVEEIDRWMKKELSRLRDTGQLQIDNLTSWQIAERQRLEELIKNNQQWSAEDYESVLSQDREHMQKMAFQYHTSVEEIEKYIQSEVERLRVQNKLNIEQLSAWKKTEQNRIMSLLQQQSNITMEEFQRKVQQDNQFLKNLAVQYHISVVEVEEYVRTVIEDLRNKGKFQVENLQNWELVERDYIKQLIAKYNNGLTTAEFEQKLRQDRVHLQQLSEQYHVNVNDIEKWMVDELKRLRQNSEQQVNMLAAWQQNEVQRLKKMIKENNHLSYVEFQVELMKERARIQQLAALYSLSVDEVEKWLRQQLVNLKATGQVQVENLTVWQEVEQKRLIDMLLRQQQQQNQTIFEEFEAELRRDSARLQDLSRTHSVSVAQIERWMRDELQRLNNSGTFQVEQFSTWKDTERNRLQEWLKRQNSKVSYEEVAAFLQRDRDNLQKIAEEYNLTQEEIERWVEEEATRLQLLGFVQRPENLVWEETWQWSDNGNAQDALWKEHTAAHLRALATVRHMNWQDFEQYLKDQRRRWEQLAQQHNITVEEIEIWLRETAQLLAQQGVIRGDSDSGSVLRPDYLIRPDVSTSVNNWQQEERKRLRTIAEDTTITEMELLEFIAGDEAFQQQLAHSYGIQRDQLAPFQRIEIQSMQQQNLFDNTQLLLLQAWQKRERDLLYKLIATQNFSLKNLHSWQRQDNMHVSKAQKYGIDVQILKAWQLQEFQRLMRLAEHYRLSLQQLQDFRNKELHYIIYIMHKKTATEEERREWAATEARRREQLSRQTGLSGAELHAWRRRLYLLAQGLLPMDFGNAGHDIGPGSTAVTGVTMPEISKDRGDQPPNVYYENMDGDEPGLAGEDPLYPPPSAALKVDPTLRPATYLPPPTPTAGGGGVQSGYRYSKTEYKYTGPVGAASASASVDASGASASAAASQPAGGYYSTPLSRGAREDNQQHELTDGGQQQQEESEEYRPRAGTSGSSASHTVDNTQGSSGRYVSSHLADGGQQQQQEEELYRGGGGSAGGNAAHSAHSTHGSYANSGRQSGGSQGNTRIVGGGQQQQQEEELVSGTDGAAAAGHGSYAGSGRYSGGGSAGNAHLIDAGQQQQQEEELYSGAGSAAASAHGRYSNAGRSSSSGALSHHQQQVEDFGQQQQVELSDYKQQQEDFGQQQVQVEDLEGTFTDRRQPHRPPVASEKQISATPNVEVAAEEVNQQQPGFWGKFKQKATNIFG